MRKRGEAKSNPHGIRQSKSTPQVDLAGYDEGAPDEFVVTDEVLERARSIPRRQPQTEPRMVSSLRPMKVFF